MRSLLVVFGIALGVGLSVATGAATDSMRNAFDDLLKRIAGRADLCVQGSGLGVPSELLSKVAALRGVAHAASSLEVTARAPAYAESLLVLGVDMLGDLHFLPFQVESGERQVIADPLAFVNDPRALLLSRSFAERHGLREGSSLQLLTAEGPQDFHVRGVLEDSGAAASFGGQVAVMFQDAAQVSFARGTFVDRIDIALEDRAQLAQVQAEISAAVGGDYNVDEPEQVGNRLRSLAAPLTLALSVTALLALIVGSFLVYNAVAIAVAQRRHEVGVLRALGETRGGMVWLFLVESVILAVPGILLGLALGRLLAGMSVASTLETLDSVFMSASQLAPELKPSLALRSAFAGIVMAVVAAYFPARRGTALDPAIVLRGETPVELKRPPVTLLLAAACACAGATLLPLWNGTAIGGFVQLSLILLAATLATPAFVVAMRSLCVPAVDRFLGIPGRLGLDYVERSLGRSTVNVLALMVAVGMSICVSSWLGSFERSLARWAEQVGTADLTVTRGSPLLDRRHVPLLDGAVTRVSNLPGVSAVQRYRLIDVRLAEVKLRLVATDTDVFLAQSRLQNKGWEAVAGAPLVPGELAAERSVVLSENAARLLNVTAGDDLSLPTPEGRVNLRVRQVVVDFSSETGTAFMDLALFHRYFHDNAVDGLFVYVERAHATDTVASAIRAALSDGAHDSSVFVTQTKSVERHMLDTVKRAFSYSRAVELMTLIIGLLGVIGTMIAAVLDRQRELSMLRAVGATRGQVALSIVVEAGFLGLCAALAGILVGVAETQVFFRTLVATTTGWHLSFVFPWESAARTTLLVVTTSALAGAIPALRALRHEAVTPTAAE